MRFLSTLTLLGAVSLSLVACSAPEEETEEGAGAIQGGAADTSHKFAVGIKLASGGVCSGVLIAPNLVLTAQHCVSGAEGGSRVDCSKDTFVERPVQAPDVTVTTDSKLPGRKKYTVTNVVVPESREMCNADIALLVLSDNVPANEAKPATPKLREMSRTGKIAAIGYGRSDSAKEDSGERRIKERIAIQCVPTASRSCNVGNREFVTAGGVCDGDAGSGAFQLSGDDATVIGILARTQRADGQCSAGIYTRTDMYAATIIASAVEAARRGNYAIPTWARPSGTASEAVPEFSGEDKGSSGSSGSSTSSSGSSGSSGEGSSGSSGSSGEGSSSGSSGSSGEGSSSGSSGTSNADEGGEEKGGGILGGLFDDVDWGDVLDFVKDVIPVITGSDNDDGKPREDALPPVPANTTPPPPPAKPADYVPPGGDRQAPPSTSSSDDSDDSDDESEDEDDATSKKKKKAASGCSFGATTPSSSSTGLLCGALALAAVCARRRRSENDAA